MKTLKSNIKAKQDHGDIKRIHDHTGISKTTLRKVFKNCLGSRRIVDAIEDYYIYVENMRNAELQKQKSA